MHGAMDVTLETITFILMSFERHYLSYRRHLQRFSSRILYTLTVSSDKNFISINFESFGNVKGLDSRARKPKAADTLHTSRAKSTSLMLAGMNEK